MNLQYDLVDFIFMPCCRPPSGSLQAAREIVSTYTVSELCRKGLPLASLLQNDSLPNLLWGPPPPYSSSPPPSLPPPPPASSLPLSTMSSPTPSSSAAVYCQISELTPCPPTASSSSSSVRSTTLSPSKSPTSPTPSKLSTDSNTQVCPTRNHD